MNISACSRRVQDPQCCLDLKSRHLCKPHSPLALSPQGTVSLPTVSPSPLSLLLADFQSPLTLEEPNMTLGILKSRIHGARQSLPVPRGQSGIPRLQLPTAQPPHKARLEEEELAPDGGHGIKGSLTDIRRGFRLGWDRGGRKDHILEPCKASWGAKGTGTESYLCLPTRLILTSSSAISLVSMPAWEPKAGAWEVGASRGRP